MFIEKLLQLMAEKKASDIFVSAGSPISIKIQGTIMPVNPAPIDAEMTEEDRLRDAHPAADRDLRARPRAQLLQAHGEPGQLPRELLLAEGLDLVRDPLRDRRHPQDGGLEPAAGALHPHHGEARAGPRGGRHRLRQVDHPRLDDRLPQQPGPGPHPHHGGPGRIRVHAEEVPGEPARGAQRHPQLPRRPAQRHAPGAGHHPDRRDPRPRDHAHGAHLRALGPPVPRDPARQQRVPGA